MEDPKIQIDCLACGEENIFESDQHPMSLDGEVFVCPLCGFEHQIAADADEFGESFSVHHCESGVL